MVVVFGLLNHLLELLVTGLVQGVNVVPDSGLEEDRVLWYDISTSTAAGEISLRDDLTRLDEFLQPVTLIVSATQQDNQDRYSITTLTITRHAESHQARTA